MLGKLLVGVLVVATVCGSDVLDRMMDDADDKDDPFAVTSHPLDDKDSKGNPKSEAIKQPKRAGQKDDGAKTKVTDFGGRVLPGSGDSSVGATIEAREGKRALDDLLAAKESLQPAVPTSKLRSFLYDQEPEKQPRKRQCSPTLFRVYVTPHEDVEEQFRWQSLSADDVLNHILVTLPLTQFAKVPESPFSNVDGRIGHPVIGAMGGDAGEFILALNAFEAVLDKPLTEFQVASLFSDFLLHVNKNVFFLQTDQMALTNLCRKVNFCLPNDRLDSPPLELIPTLRSELLVPENMGCSHIRHLLLDTDGYLTRRPLVESFLRSFFNLLWGVPINSMSEPVQAMARSKLKLQVLRGPHVEGAIVHVNTSHCSERFTPMVVPEYGKVSVGVHHVDAVRQLRAATASFLNDQAKKQGLVHADMTDAYFERTLVNRMNDIADKQFHRARVLDDGHTPVYIVKYPPECCMGAAMEEGTAEPPPYRM
jgi:hypothetical protein